MGMRLAIIIVRYVGTCTLSAIRKISASPITSALYSITQLISGEVVDLLHKFPIRISLAISHFNIAMEQLFNILREMDKYKAK